MKEIEEEYLNGQKLQGPLAAEEVMFMLEAKQASDKYVLTQQITVFILNIPLCEFVQTHPS